MDGKDRMAIFTMYKIISDILLIIVNGICNHFQDVKMLAELHELRITKKGIDMFLLERWSKNE